jgi:caffeoyl-CoA O-methyltransferase
MNEITNAAVERYMYAMLPKRDDVLRDIEAEAEKRNIPIVGPAVARFLYLLALTSRAQQVFEMGSAVGYSTIWWARAVGPGGRVVYTDGSRQNAEEAKRNFERAGVADRIDIRVGDALEILSEQKEGQYDIIFNDVDKEDYPRVLKLAVPRLRKGGLFVADNVLWKGQVAQAAAMEDNIEPDARTRAIAQFNRAMYESKELFPTILPLRDGVAVAIKV